MILVALSPALLDPCAAVAECKDQHSCSNCTQAKGTLAACEWCPADRVCAEFYLQTKCSKDTIVHAVGKCPSPAPAWQPPAWRTSELVSQCEAELLQCRHNTMLNDSFCADIRFLRWPADLQTARSLSWLDNEDHFFAKCNCPFYLNGTDCSLVVPNAALPADKVGFAVCGKDGAGDGHLGPNQTERVWDGTFINKQLTEVKHMECYLNKSNTPFKLTAHRVNVSLTQNLNNAAMRDVHIQILQRRREDHPQAQTAELINEMKACFDAGLMCKWPLTGPCATDPKCNPCLNAPNKSLPPPYGEANCLFPRHNEIDCKLKGCSATYQPGTVGGTWDAVYDCTSATCKTWAGLETVAKALIAPINLQKTISFKFTDINEKLGKARGYFVTKTLTLEMQCSTGQCISSNETASPKRPAIKTKVSAWEIASAVCVSLLVLCGGGIALAVAKQRRPIASPAVNGASTPREQFGGVSVAFDHVTYDVTISKTKRRVLQGASGLVLPGELCAIMGPSGAGKSSLLDIIAGQRKRGTVGGRMQMLKIDGKAVAVNAHAESRWPQLLAVCARMSS